MQAEITKRASRDRLATYSPYSKQREFHALGKTHRIRALFGGNRLGKTWPTTAEGAMHLTGEYPDWWEGHRLPSWDIWSEGMTRTNAVRCLDGSERLGQLIQAVHFRDGEPMQAAEEQAAA